MPTISEITLAVGSKTMIQAKATKTDYRNSNIASKTITVYSGTVATPVITDGHDGTFTITCGTAGATIIYTTDGSTPSASNGTEYTAEVTAEYGDTIKAFAYKELYLDSAEATPVTLSEWSSPANITGLWGWWDANDASTITVDGSDNITEWAEKTGNAASMLQNSTDPTPSYDSTNSKVVFDAVNLEYLKLDTTDLSAAANITIAIILKINSVGVAQYIFGQYVSGYVGMQITTGGYPKINYGASLEVEADSTAIQAEQRLLIFNYIDGGTSSINGYKCGSNETDIAVSGNAGNKDINTGAYIGRVPGGTYYLNADVKSIIILEGTITDSDLANLKSYCETNYGADI